MTLAKRRVPQVATLAPSTATRAEACTSWSVKKTPSVTSQRRTAGKSWLVPWTELFQFWLAYTSWAPERTMGAT